MRIGFRPWLDRRQDTVRPSLDLVGRNLADLVGLIAELEQRKINF